MITISCYILKTNKSKDVHKVCGNANIACQKGVKRCQLVRHPNHYNIVVSSTVDQATNKMDSAVLKYIIASGHKFDVNDVALLDREKNWMNVV